MNKEIKGLQIVRNCGRYSRFIYIIPNTNLIQIGCSEYTKKDAINAVKKKYSDSQKYIEQINECFEMVPIPFKELKDDSNCQVRLIVTKYSDEYHKELKDDKSWIIRIAVARYSDKYHNELKDDEIWSVRKAVAEYSDKYHKYLKDDKNNFVRVAVARYSDKYHEELKDDKIWEVRRAVARYSYK